MKLMRKLFCFAFVTLLAIATAPAQDWAKARLEKSPRHLEWVKVKNGSRTVDCYVAYPEVKDKATAVIVIHEIFGLTDWVRTVADQLAEAGYIAITPDLLSGTGPKGGGTAELGGRDAVGKAIRSLPPEQITGDLNAVADYLKKLPSCNGKLAVAGFCWGGAQSFRYACNNKDLKASFVFYGTPPTKDQMEKIPCPVYGFYGGDDNRVTSTVADTTKEMKELGKRYEPVTYEGAGHGFMRAAEDPEDKRPANKKAHDEAWKKMKQVLKTL
jgi:carboxymethylenebutenolidase